MTLDAVREVFRSYFLEELRVDPGWDEFLDLILSNMDLRALDFMQSNGVPYSIAFNDFGDLFKTSGPFVEVLHVSDSSRSSEGYTLLGFNMPLRYKFLSESGLTTTDLQWFDFTAASLMSRPQSVSYYTSTDLDAAPQWLLRPSCYYYVPQTEEEAVSLDTLQGLSVLVEPVVPITWSERVDLFTYADGKPCCFFVKIWDYVHDESGAILRDAVSGEYFPTIPALQLATVPETLNGAEILNARRRSGAGTSLYGTSPYASALFGALFGLGLNYAEVPFRIYLASDDRLGTPTASYSSFVEFWQVLDALHDFLPRSVFLNPEVVGLVSAEDTRVDAVRDYWGTGDSIVSSFSTKDRLRRIATRYGSILGYDKKLWVVGSNAPFSDLNFLGHDGGDASAPYINTLPTDMYFTQYGSSASAPGGSVRVFSDVAAWEAYVYNTSDPIYISPVTIRLDLSSWSGKLLVSPTDGSGVTDYLVTPDSRLGEPVYGITKNYVDMSIPDGFINRLVLSFGVSEDTFIASQFGGDSAAASAFLSRLQSLLEGAVPAGVSVQVLFGTDAHPVTLRFAMEVGTPDFFIRVSPSVVTSSGSESFSSSVSVESNTAWHVTSRVAPYIRVGANEYETSSSYTVELGPTSGSPASVYVATNSTVVVNGSV